MLLCPRTDRGLGRQMHHDPASTSAVARSCWSSRNPVWRRDSSKSAALGISPARFASTTKPTTPFTVRPRLMANRRACRSSRPATTAPISRASAITERSPAPSRLEGKRSISTCDAALIMANPNSRGSTTLDCNERPTSNSNTTGSGIRIVRYISGSRCKCWMRPKYSKSDVSHTNGRSALIRPQQLAHLA